MLAERLARRGVTLETIAVAVVPPALVDSTVHAVMLVSAGAEVAVAGSAIAVMRGVLKIMFLNKMKVAVGVFLVLGALSFAGFAFIERPTQAQAQAPAGKPPTEVDILRMEVELLRLRLQAVEAEVRELKGRQDTKTALPERPAGPAPKTGGPKIPWGRKAATGPAAKPPADLTQAVEAALKRLKEAKDDKSRQDAADALDRATKRLKEHLRRGRGQTDALPKGS
jgi:hypothetical protein